MERVWRERLRKRRELLERWQWEDEASRKEGFVDPGSKNFADAQRPGRENELTELRILDALCEYGEDAFWATGV